MFTLVYPTDLFDFISFLCVPMIKNKERMVIKCIVSSTRTAQLFFAVTALNCYSEKELSCSGPNR